MVGGSDPCTQILFCPPTEYSPSPTWQAGVAPSAGCCIRTPFEYKGCWVTAVIGLPLDYGGGEQRVGSKDLHSFKANVGMRQSDAAVRVTRRGYCPRRAAWLRADLTQWIASCGQPCRPPGLWVYALVCLPAGRYLSARRSRMRACRMWCQQQNYSWSAHRMRPPSPCSCCSVGG